MWGGDTHSFLWNKDCDWHPIIRNYIAQALLPFVSGTLLNIDSTHSIPADLKKRIYEYIAANAQTHHEIRLTYNKIIEILAQQGITPIIIKGEELAEIFPLPDMRTCGDIDLFLPPTQCDKAIQILKAHGAQYYMENTYHHEMHFDACTVELHHHMVYDGTQTHEYGVNELTEKFLTDEVLRSWPTAEQLSKTKITAYRLPRQVELLFIFVHLAKHMQSAAGIRQFIDLALLLDHEKDTIDKDLFVKQVNGIGLTRLWNYAATFMTTYLGLRDSVCPAYTPQHGMRYRLLCRHIIRSGNFGKNTSLSFQRDGAFKAMLAFLSSFWKGLILFPKPTLAHTLFLIKLLIKRRGFKR